MPIITLYGAKGGTGRTTTTTAIALGMLARGMHVMLVETDTSDDPLARWWAGFDNPGFNAGDLDYRRCTTPADIDLLLRIAPSDDRQAIIFDTSPRVSAVRSYALELASGPDAVHWPSRCRDWDRQSRVTAPSVIRRRKQHSGHAAARQQDCSRTIAPKPANHAGSLTIKLPLFLGPRGGFSPEGVGFERKFARATFGAMAYFYFI